MSQPINYADRPWLDPEAEPFIKVQSVSKHFGDFTAVVSDHGPGIPEAFRERIFQKFAQADASDRRQKGGTGLGLSICKAILEQLGGRIDFETEAGKGTTLYFDLPEADT